MAIIVKTALPTALGIPMSNLYLRVNEQHTNTRENLIEYACEFFVSKEARMAGGQPVQIGNHPMAILGSANKEKLTDVLGRFSLPNPVTIQTGATVFTALQECYYGIVKELIVKIEVEFGLTIEIENDL